MSTESSLAGMPGTLAPHGEPIAQPAFRTLAFLDGPQDAPAIAAGMAQIFDLFWQHHGEAVDLVADTIGTNKGQPREINARRLEAARSWIAAPVGAGHAVTLRMTAEATEAFPGPNPPWFRLEQRYRDMTLLEMSVPPGAPGEMEFADGVAEVLKTLPMVCAVQGYGFFLPNAFINFSDALPRAAARYRAAILITPDMAVRGLREGHSLGLWPEGTEPGMADIGWRSFVGTDFLPRLPGLADAPFPAEVRLEMAPTCAVLTAGEAPIWGDVNAGEDVSAYRAVAAALAPVRYPASQALDEYFQGVTLDDGERTDAILAYLARLDAEGR